MLNDYYQNIGIKEYFVRYGLINGIKRGLFNLCPFHFIKDYELKKILWQKKATKYVRKYLKYKDEQPEGLVFNSSLPDDHIIWIYWNKGLENAPKIIQLCYQSIVKYGQDKVILLDESNVDQYILFPDSIKEKVKNGNIPMAVYTDLLRFALLSHYGGTWIDSTVYLSKDLSKEILDSNFFILRNSMGLVDNPALYPVWFIRSNKDNKLMQQVRNVAFAYWTKEKHVIEYLFSNLILTEIIKENKAEKDILYMNSDYSEYLVRCLGDTYHQEQIQWIFQLTNIHKLTYKLDQSIDNGKSIYSYLLTLREDINE